MKENMLKNLIFVIVLMVGLFNICFQQLSVVDSSLNSMNIEALADTEYEFEYQKPCGATLVTEIVSSVYYNDPVTGELIEIPVAIKIKNECISGNNDTCQEGEEVHYYVNPENNTNNVTTRSCIFV
jgi:hypothetical protein